MSLSVPLELGERSCLDFAVMIYARIYHSYSIQSQYSHANLVSRNGNYGHIFQSRYGCRMAIVQAQIPGVRLPSGILLSPLSRIRTPYVMGKEFAKLCHLPDFTNTYVSFSLHVRVCVCVCVSAKHINSTMFANEPMNVFST